MLRVPAALYDEVIAEAERAYPEECCGIIIGLEGYVREVAAIVRCQNIAADPMRRYLIAPENLITAQREARKAGQHIIGFYHSHPDHPAQPSPTDQQNAYWPSCSYFIISVVRGKAGEAASFHLVERRLEPEPHLVAEGSA